MLRGPGGGEDSNGGTGRAGSSWHDSGFLDADVVVAVVAVTTVLVTGTPDILLLGRSGDGGQSYGGRGCGRPGRVFSSHLLAHPVLAAISRSTVGVARAAGLVILSGARCGCDYD